MTRDQQSILWLGLILVSLNIIVNLSEFKQMIFGKGPAGNPSTTNAVSPPVKSGTPQQSNPVISPGQIAPQPQTTPQRQLV